MFANIVKGAQRGLLLRPLFGQILTITLRDRGPASRQAVLEVVRKLAKASEAAPQPAGLVTAFAPELWGRWQGREIAVSRKVLNHSPKLRDTGGDVLLYVKASDAETAHRLVAELKPALDLLASHIEVVEAGKSENASRKTMRGRAGSQVFN